MCTIFIFQATLSNDVMQLETNINTTVMNVSRVFATTEDLIANITGQALNGFLNDVSGIFKRVLFLYSGLSLA